MFSCKSDESDLGNFQLQQMLIGSIDIDLSGSITDEVPVDRSITLILSNPINQASAQIAISLQNDTGTVDFNLNFTSQDRNVVLSPIGLLQTNSLYTLILTDQLQDIHGQHFAGARIQFKTMLGGLTVLSVQLGGSEILNESRVLHTPLDFEMNIDFSTPVDQNSFEAAVQLRGPQVPSLDMTLTNNNKSVTITGTNPLSYLSKYDFELDNSVKGAEGQGFVGYDVIFYTRLDSTLKFPEITEEQFLTKVQQETFKYFWDFAHPVSGLARERNTSGELVTIGGSGFGLMAILVGIERGFVSRSEAIERISKIINFLGNEAERFHGAWPHWLNGTTGTVIPFSADDDGGDLVETAFMTQALLTVRQYLDANDPLELSLIDEINNLWEAIEWDWYTQEGQNVLYWHWSPNFGWQKNLKISGYNEALIVYILAASSPTFTIDAEVYHEGWARNGAIVNGNQYLGFNLPLGFDYGGPLFFTHYSFLGLDPRNLSDQYADYWEQNVNHTLINREWCITNPLDHVGYSVNSWGLTASDNHQGYSAHSPTNDLGVITPTAAISSIPYTPDHSLAAMQHFYYLIGDRLWGDYGFYDAFNFNENWVADSYLAIDQGPIIIMIENHRSGLLWDLFMSAPEVQAGLQKLGFSF